MPRRRRSATRHGWIVIDKPAGWTSHDVVARVRRIVDERRVGHAGTLDPAATGVLPVAVGLATRTVEYLSNADKSYRGWIRFGVTTDSADNDGKVTSVTDASALTRDQIEPLLDEFRGEIAQRPPMHSAIKVEGTRLYHLARKGAEVEVEPRSVTIHELRLVAWEPPVLCVDVTCSKGTYVRSLARDIGERAGPGALLDRLVRTRSGPFGLDDALTLEQLEQELDSGGWPAVAFSPDYVLGDLPTLVLGDDEALAWSQGKPVPISGSGQVTSPVRAYNAAGAWLGIGDVDPEHRVVRPTKVITAG
jgi:tRNA pseudouridine55 synthase